MRTTVWLKLVRRGQEGVDLGCQTLRVKVLLIRIDLVNTFYCRLTASSAADVPCLTVSYPSCRLSSLLLMTAAFWHWLEATILRARLGDSLNAQLC